MCFLTTIHTGPSPLQFSKTYTHGQVLHYPLVHKVSVIRTLYHHTKALSSLQRIDEEKHANQAPARNGYSRHQVHKTALHTCHTAPLMPPAPQQQPDATVTLPYVQGLSETNKRALDSLNIKVCFHPHRPDTTPTACQAKGPGTPRGTQWGGIQNPM